MEKDTLIPARRLLAIGGSAGSLEVILKILPHLDGGIYEDLSIVIILHRKPLQDSPLTGVLADKTNWRVKEADEKEPIQPRHIYVAPADYHLLLENDYSFSLDDSEKINYSRPSIDVTFESAAEVYGPNITGLLLSGANSDGAGGLQCIRDAGGTCLVQDPASAEVAYMPMQAIKLVQVHHVLPAEQIGTFLSQLYGRPSHI